jgi:hypothetical protein
MPAATTLADLNDELSDALGAVADDPSAEGDVSTVNDPNSADGFVFGGEKPGDIDYPASEDEAPDLTVDGTDSSEFAPAGFGIASASDGDSATPIFGSGGGALDVTAQMAEFSFGDSLSLQYKAGDALTTSTTSTSVAAGRWHALPTVAAVSGAKQTYSVAAASSAYCEVKTVLSSGVTYTYLRVKKIGACKVGITAGAAPPYLAGINYFTYTLGKGTLVAPAPGAVVGVPPATPALASSTITLLSYFDDGNTSGYQAATGSPKITWSEATGGTASAAACVVASGKLTLKPVAGDSTKTCKIKGLVAASTNWPAYSYTYTVTFTAP